MAVLIFLMFLLLVAYLILIDFYQQGWSHLPVFVPGKRERDPFISVVIAARNEEKNLPELFNALLKQNYPGGNFEIIVVDDHSTDNTWNLLQQFSPPGIAVRTFQLEQLMRPELQSGAYKKWAIQAGVEQARGELIVSTDADCLPQPGWLECIASFYLKHDAAFIAAPVRLQVQKLSLLSVFQALDFLTLQGITGASVFRKFHSMCNGANLAYNRTAFMESGGFRGIDNIPSGDDMFLMHKIRVRYPDRVFYLKSPAAIVSTRPEPTWKSFLQQRIRWSSKADRYQDRSLFWALLLVYLVNLGFLALAITAFFPGSGLFFLLLFLLGKIIIEYPFVAGMARFFGQKRLMNFFILLQPLHILYILLSGWMGKFGSYTWKDRIVKK